VDIRVQTDLFDPGAETNAFLVEAHGAGAAVTFTGVVRSLPDEPINTLTLECYPELALRQLEKLAAEAVKKFSLLRVAVIHRYGTMQPGEPIVQVMALAEHRHAAFHGAEFLMDYLKSEAPFWKKEASQSGEQWVEALDADEQSKTRWS
jgi:molybdopterin synthase catalytic subunit